MTVVRRPLLLMGVLAGVLLVPAAALAATPYTTPEGDTVQVSFSPSLAPDPAVAQSYVDFLGSLPHGSELSSLDVEIVAPSEIQADCGGEDGTLACYSSQTHTMTVPDAPIDATTDGISTAYIIAHEYGHHVATFRDDAPFPAIDYGPKYWSSYEQVCLGSLQGRLFPGNEGRFYFENPGEAWAETYAHLVFPDVEWRFAPSLQPTPAPLAAARRDVTSPWQGNVTKTFTGKFTSTSSNARHFKFRLTLDGALSVALHGPSGTNFDLALVSRGKVEKRTTAAGSSDTISYPNGACRETPTETVTLSVSRKKGNGAFSVKVSYAG